MSTTPPPTAVSSPMAPPPSSAPPPPPPSPDKKRSSETTATGASNGTEEDPSSSQKKASRKKRSAAFWSKRPGGRLAASAPPQRTTMNQPNVKITEESYGTIPSATRATMPPLLSSSSLRNPNVGVSNSAEGAGTTLPEIVWRLRLINLVVCSLAIAFELPSLLKKLFFDPAHMVLGAYLIFFSLLLCCFELHTPVVANVIRDQFGLLYNPHGRACFLLLMGGLCVGQGGIDYVLGAILVGNAIYTEYVAIRYPTYAKMHDRADGSPDDDGDGEEDLVDVMRGKVQRYAWANPELVTRLARGGGTEGESLVGS